MKKVRLTSGTVLKEDRTPIACPWSANPQERLYCGDWCPHFRVDETIFSGPSGVSRAVKVVRISCSGQEVGLEVVE